MRREQTWQSTKAVELGDLIADDFKILQGSRPRWEKHQGDVDCAVSGLDRFWPLRLRPGWRLCQRLHYDVRSWYWILDHDGNVVCVDVLDDPRGLGRDGFPSSLAFERNGEPADKSPVAASAVRAGYLTVKRLRKAIRAPAEWESISELARVDPESFRTTLAVVLGFAVADSLADHILRGEVPPDGLWHRARRSQRLRRFRTPARAVAVPALQLARVPSRLARPTGLLVVVAGPDGVGKSTLAARLPDACCKLFRRSVRHHSRAGILPRPGALLRRPQADTTQPHLRAPHGVALSAALVFYHWLDSVLGHMLHVALFRARTGLVVVERGWWDLAVDPHRYRIQPPRRLVAALGRLLPRPDLTLVLTASEDAILERKPELPRDELARQQRAWRDVLPADDAVFLNATNSETDVLDAARAEVVALLEQRALSRIGAGWVTLPNRAHSRWILPRGPRRVARGALQIYNPNTPRARLAWELARAFASLGGFRVLPRGAAPPNELRKALAPYLPARSTYALARANHPERFVALIVDEAGTPSAACKLATDDAGRAALAREVEALESRAAALPSPLSPPVILAHDEGVLLLEYVPWRPRSRPWLVPAEVAAGLGAFFRTTSDERSASRSGFAHGDFAPWNLLRTSTGWVVIDWEAAWENAPPFFDLFHYVVQAHWLLRRPKAAELSAGLIGKGPVAEAIGAYAEGAGLDPDSAGTSFEEYLRLTSEGYAAKTIQPEGIRLRRHLLHEFRAR